MLTLLTQSSLTTDPADAKEEHNAQDIQEATDKNSLDPSELRSVSTLRLLRREWIFARLTGYDVILAFSLLDDR
jgi:hypothetical protein